ncbi:MAG: secondary thiamine-phosphate synthase enzyme YjbQ [Glaciecola sp.]
MQQIQLTLPAFPRGFHLITRHVEQAIDTLPQTGLLHVFIQHSSASLSINENADPSVRVDMESHANVMVPENSPHFTHTYEGCDDMPAHVKASLFGSSVSIPIVNHALGLGTWQGIYLGEHRNHGGPRRLVITVI